MRLALYVARPEDGVDGARDSSMESSHPSDFCQQDDAEHAAMRNHGREARRKSLRGVALALVVRATGHQTFPLFFHGRAQAHEKGR